MPAQIKPQSFESRWNSFFTRDGCASCLFACLGARVLPQSYQYLNLSEGADRVGGQLRGDNECPFSGVTKSGRVWRKVPESDAFSADSLTVSVQPEPCYRRHSDSDYVSTQFYNKESVSMLSGISWSTSVLTLKIRNRHF